MSTEDLRKEILLLAGSKKIPHTAAAIKKYDDEQLKKVKEEYEASLLEDSNKELAKLMTKCLTKITEQLNMIVENSEKYEKDNMNDTHLQRDMEKIASYVTPYFPFPGLFSGAVRTAAYTYDEKTDEVNKNE